MTATQNYKLLDQVTRDRVKILKTEGKDPSKVLMDAEATKKFLRLRNMNFYGGEELKEIREIIKIKGDSMAEVLLLGATPSPAVLNELRKIYSSRAWKAKKEGDWEKVLKHLAEYNNLALKHFDYCIELVNQPPPEHTARDLKLLEQAKVELDKY